MVTMLRALGLTCLTLALVSSNGGGADAGGVAGPNTFVELRSDDSRTANTKAAKQLVANFEKAVENGSVEELMAALQGMLVYDNAEFVSLYERVLELPPLAGAAKSAEAVVDGMRPSVSWNSAIGGDDPNDGWAELAAWEAWRPHGIAAWTQRIAARPIALACAALVMRVEFDAVHALLQAVASESVRANPLAFDAVVRQLAELDRDHPDRMAITPQLELELSALIGSVGDLSAEDLLLTLQPNSTGDASSLEFVNVYPAASAAHFFAVRGARQRVVMERVADGLLLGVERLDADLRADPVAVRERLKSDTALAAAACVGRECELALLSLVQAEFTWGDEESHAAALARIAREVEPPTHGRLVFTGGDGVAPIVAALESAIEAGDGVALDIALDTAVHLEDLALLDVFKQILTLPVLPDAALIAPRTTDERIRRQIEFFVDISSEFGTGLEPETIEALAKSAEPWRPMGIEIEELRLSARHAERVCENLRRRGDEASFDTLVRALKSPGLRANPFAHTAVVRTLARLGHTSTTLDDELCRLIRSADRLDTEFTRLRSTFATMRVGPFDAEASSPFLEPLLEAARYFEARGTKRRKVVATLIDGLMFGYDPKEEVGPFGVALGSHPDRRIEHARQVGRACSRALEACTKKYFRTLSPEVYDAAEDWLKREGKDYGFK
jgi:hypothetical protein